MKALISPNETFDYSWISSWTSVDDTWQPVYSEILGCTRVAQVEPDNKVFDVALPLYWMSCPDNCVADFWYFKSGQVIVKPIDVDKPA